MLTSILTKSAALGITLFAMGTVAEALTEDQVIDRLTPIPVFTIMTTKGEPVIMSVKNKGKDNQVVRFFMSYNDAQGALAELKKSNLELAKETVIRTGAMPQFFELQKQNKGKNIGFYIIPARNSLEASRQILKGQGKPTDRFDGIPVFFATGDKDGMLTIEEGGKRYTPFYFDQGDLKNLISEYRKANPNVPQPKIDVAPLDQVLGSMITTPKNKPDPAVQTFQFVPSSTALQKAIESQAGSKK